MIEAPRIKLRKESEIIETIKNLYLAGVDVEDFTVYVHDENIRLFSGPYNHIFKTMFGDLPVEFIEELSNDEFVILPNIKGEDELMDFGEAIKALKNGYKVCRKGWNGKGMFIVYQKGYPTGIPCNKQTAIAWKMNEGDLFKCEPYLQIRMTNGSHSMWVPSINDVLSEDWMVVD